MYGSASSFDDMCVRTGFVRMRLGLQPQQRALVYSVDRTRRRREREKTAGTYRALARYIYLAATIFALPNVRTKSGKCVATTYTILYHIHKLCSTILRSSQIVPAIVHHRFPTSWAAAWRVFVCSPSYVLSPPFAIAVHTLPVPGFI